MTTDNTLRVFDDVNALLDYYGEGQSAWLSLVSAQHDPYLLTSSEHGDVFVQTFRSEDHVAGSYMADDLPTGFFPARLVSEEALLP